MRINSKFLRLPQVIDRTGYRKTAIYERIQQGDFPRPVKLGPRAVGWLGAPFGGFEFGRHSAS